MPKLELDAEAEGRVREILARPASPSAAQENLAHAKQKLRSRGAAANATSDAVLA